MKRNSLLARWGAYALVTLLASLVPGNACALDGSQVVAGGGVIDFTGATATNWVKTVDGADFLILYTNTTASGSFVLPGTTKAQILAVGGGGGGGGTYNQATTMKHDGGAGGGGGGAVIETNALFGAAIYQVSVGEGGLTGAVVGASARVTAGTNGADTVILRGMESFLRALGGGGGGGFTNGLDGASGGGGSMRRLTSSSHADSPGGKGLQGFDGGAGAVPNAGGGGGGAGGAGADGVTNYTGTAWRAIGGKGGDGVASSITGTEKWYGGGGGGGTSTGSDASVAALGGKGGGGKGGVGTSTTATATNGEDGTGGGGGGASKKVGSGRGGSGIVIVRITAATSGNLEKPKDIAWPYQAGTARRAIEPSVFYTISGHNVATNVGTYIASAKPVAGVTWTDGSADEVTVVMTITEAGAFSGSAEVTGASIAFTGAAETNWVENTSGGYDLLLKFTGAGSYTLPGTTKAQILAVGGGGGGGGTYNQATTMKHDGGAGGGGGGGVVETNALFGAAKNYVTVGAGGGPGAVVGASARVTAGTNGADTVILRGMESFLRALGGGGGGGFTNGLDGASGGGGSMRRLTSSSHADSPGGKGLQGFDGGAGAVPNAGGGGGGAGGAGADGVTNYTGTAWVAIGGKGGDGVASMITGTEKWYGGGGGGGTSTGTDTSVAALGGKGGGGKGGVGTSTATATNGEKGTGGGGGGANKKVASGWGGSGVVIVRISATMEGTLVKPAETVTFTYDGKEHTSVKPNPFYTLSGDYSATDAGTYVSTVKLLPGCTWTDGTVDDVTVTMTINPIAVTISGLTMPSWQYTPRKAETPEPTYTVSPAWVTPIVEYAASREAPEKDWTATKPLNVGSYCVRVRLADTRNFSFTTQYATFSVTRRKVTITELFQKDWMFGTPTEAIPKPRCTIDPSWVNPTYEYADSEESETWTTEKPTAIGTHWLRASVPDTVNYDCKPVKVSFNITKGLGETFIDYVEIEIDAYKGTNPEALTNFPYKVTLSEENPYGFLYSRTDGDGQELGVTDAGGTVLPYRLENWNVHGDSVLYVRLPVLGPSNQVIRLYWKLRPLATAPDHKPETVWEKWKREDVAKISVPAYTFDLVVRNGYRVNRWLVKPSMKPTVWTLGATPGTLTPGALVEGTYSTRLFDSLTGADVTFPPTKAGAYRYLFTLDNPDLEYEDLSYHIDFAVTASNPMDDLQGDAPSLTANGRVLIANDDDAEGHKVWGQSYWHTNSATEAIWWEHKGANKAQSTFPRLRDFAGDSHWLYYRESAAKTNILWRLENILLGNTYNKLSDEDTLYGTRVYLPCSPTGLSITLDDTTETNKGHRCEAGMMVMQNTLNAVLYSPCYTGGVGTIYFDAANVQYHQTTTASEDFGIAIDIATNVIDEAGNSLPPTDENARQDGIDFARLKEERWFPVKALPLRRDNNAANFTKMPETENILLDIAKGGSVSNFFRICVNLDIREPVRFRIRRTGYIKDSIEDLATSYIALDNILVSYPKSTANLRPMGKYDPEKTGQQINGHEGAFSVPFPAITDGDIYGRATNEIFLSENLHIDPQSLVSLSRLHYRWRYLDQAVSNTWNSVDLSPLDNYVAQEPLKIPNDGTNYDEGDIEFFYENFMNVPFYRYFDYSGSGLGLGGLYTEETGTVTNRLDKNSYSAFYGSGDDWFIRLRTGKSEWASINVIVDGAYQKNVPMELIDDHLWRGLVKVPSNATGKVTVKFHAEQRRGAWSDGLLEPERWWYPTADVPKMPWRGETVFEPPKVEHGYAADWASGYMEFQLNDETGLFLIGHAEYQNFNAWHDAHLDSKLFVGSLVETSGVNQAAMIQTNAHIHTWSLHTVSNSNWNESFYLANYMDEGYPKYTDYLTTHKMPGQWTGENGFFVDANLVTSNKTEKEKNSGIAWQMRGNGSGSISFTQNSLPAGLDQISFTARLGQSIDFYDFSVWDGDGSTTANNYTFGFPALMSVNNGTDYAPGATLSVVGYYRSRVGCYEFRITRDASDGLLFSLYKWAVKNTQMKSQLLCSHWFKSATCQDSSKGTTPKAYHMFISVGQEVDGQTTIIGGLSAAGAQYPSDAYSGAEHRVIKYVDETNPHTQGGFGALASNCKGLFLMPRHWTHCLPAGNLVWGGSDPDTKTALPSHAGRRQAVTFVNTGTDSSPQWDRKKIETEKSWLETIGRLEYDQVDYGSALSACALRTPNDMCQKIGVYLKPMDGSGAGWSLYETRTVNSYQFDKAKPFTVTVRTNVSCQVMLKTDSEWPSDAAVWDIKQSAWTGEDINGIDSLSRDFVYTQARIVDEIDSTKKTNRVAILQPARALPTKALSIRSPVLQGLGMAGFSYKNLVKGAEIWLQVTTNGTDRLSGSSGYNYSTKSFDRGQPVEEGAWMTLRKYTYDELKQSTEQAFYLGWHTRTSHPLSGVFRLFIPTNIVIAAGDRVKTDPEYGSITITDFYVHDEPAIDERSWMGWNLRTIGDTGDTEKRMFLPDVWAVKSGDQYGAGLSAALNNSYTKDIDGKPEQFKEVNPTIQTPTFGEYAVSNGTALARIGQVRFRARLYGKEGDPPAKVTIYAATDGTTMDWGTPVTNYLVTSPRYRLFEYRPPSDQRFAAVRLVVDGVIKDAPDLQRVLLDEVVVSERSNSSVGFEYARPFRTGLTTENVIEDILDKSQQPLTDESWGVQARLKLNQFSDEIDLDRGVRVTIRFYEGATKWGYDEWKDDPTATDEVELMSAGAKSDLIFRSTVSDSRTVGPVMRASSGIVQYMLKVYYYEKGNQSEQFQLISVTDEEGEGWTNPAWYAPVDYNREGNMRDGALKPSVSPYSIFDAIAPGRAWINEVNYNDGPREQNGMVKCETNQFIEIAVPWGVDMTGWRLRMTDFNHATATMAVLGRNGLPAKRQTEDGHRSGDYDFYVLESPKTRDNGGIRDPKTGEKIAVGAWTDETLSSTLYSGTLQNDEPYQFELVRPSGIIEHIFVVGGTNEYRHYEGEWVARFDATNLFNELNVLVPNPNRFIAGDDLARLTSSATTLASIGVTGGAHGEEGGWSADMRFTPGRVNEGQDELSNWYIRPNGGACWVYLTVIGDHISQRIGEDKSRQTFFIVGEGQSTNVEYTAAPWYQVDTVSVAANGKTNVTKVAREGTFTFSIDKISNTTHVVATEGIAQRLIDAGLNLSDRYTPAVMKWLEGGMANGKAFAHPGGEIRKMTYREIGVEDSASDVAIGLKGMYWFDIDPTEGGWWLRGKNLDVRAGVRRTWYTSSGEALGAYDNVQVQVKLYLSNDTDRAVAEVYAPPRLQGLNGEQSDNLASYSNWTSVTFKVEGELLNKMEHNEGFKPFRWFVFGPGSFAPAGGPDEFTTWVELIDPFSAASPGYSYGWSPYRGKAGSAFRWNISEEMQPTGVERLEADATYEGKRPFVKPTP